MPARSRFNMPIYFSVPPDIVAEFDALAGSGYGARSAMFLREHKFFLRYKGSSLDEAFEIERSRRLVAEAKLNQLEAAMRRIFG